MAPVAGVVLLVVLDAASSRVETGSRLRREARHVRDPLLLVDDQVLDDVQVLGLGLRAQARRVVAVGAAVVHVHVQVAAPPAAGGQVRQALEAQARRGRRAGRRPRRSSHRRVLEPVRREHRVRARGQRQRGRALRVEVMHLERPHFAVEAVVGVAPRVVRRPAASVRPGHREAHGRRRPRRVGHRHRAASPAGAGSGGSPDDRLHGPPGIVTTRSDTLPPSFVTNAMRRPSGDQRGRVWSHSP